MRPQDAVAIILALAIFGTLISDALIIPTVVPELAQDVSEAELAAWDNILALIVGALAGYIASKKC